MESWLWFEPVGFATFCLLIGVPVTLGTSLFLLARYRGSVLRSMLTVEGEPGPPALPPPLPASDRGGGGVSTALRLLDSQSGSRFDSELVDLARRARRRMGRAVLFAGLAHTCVAALLLLPASQIEFGLVRFVALWLVLAWPVVPSALFVSVGDRRLRLLAPVVFLLVGWLLLPIPFSQFAFLAAWLGGIPMGLAVLMSSRRVRAVAPFVFVSVILVLVAANVALGLAYTALVSIEVLPVVPTLVLLLLVAAAAAVIGGRAFLRLLARRYRAKKTSDQLLTLNLWWTLYSVWISILLATGWNWGGIAGVVPLALYFAVLGGQLSRAGQDAASTPRRLLLLRVFGFRQRAERLLEDLGRLWRYVGTVELIAGTDLASANLEPHELLEFLGGRLNRQFVNGEEDLAERLRERDEAPDPDGRFRVQEFFCHDNTWRATLRRLAEDADAVLMDLRGFSSANKGCEYELGQLLTWVPLGRVMLLVDGTTDRPLLAGILETQWRRLPRTAVNGNRRSAELRVHEVDGRGAAAAKAIFVRLVAIMHPRPVSRR